MVCEHTCTKINHQPIGASQFKLNCCTNCPSCRQPISYGSIDHHLKNCHSNSSKILIFPAPVVGVTHESS